MCLLSFVKIGDQQIFTSNRDISHLRPKALNIQAYKIRKEEIHFPKDHKGGTWLAYNQKKILFLLNGAKENHVSKSSYRKSRGLILLELFQADSITEDWNLIDLTDIEPFTLVAFQKGDLIELIWDGIQKTTTQKNTEESHIWLSSTLYTQEEKKSVSAIFNSKNFSTSEQLLSFNQEYNYGSIKDVKTRIERVKTTCHYQLIKLPTETKCLEILN
jgi:uncharacterized protein with NRDE domain